MASKKRYDDSDSTAHTALTAEELDSLLLTDGSAFAHDSRKIRHLLTRMRAAFAAQREQMRSLQRDMELIHADARRKASPLTGALDALRNLTQDEQRQVFDISAGGMLDAIQQARSDAERVKLAARSEANRVRFALAKVLSDPSVPAEFRALVDDTLRALPADAGAVTDSGISWQPLPTVDGSFNVPASDSEEALSDALFGSD